jgi:hypothetical protein
MKYWAVIASGAPASGAGPLTLTAGLTKAHAANVTVYGPNDVDPTGDMTRVFGQGTSEWNEGFDSQVSPAGTARRNKAQTDFVGIAIHCADPTKPGICTGNAHATPDPLPDEAGGYVGFKGLFGTKSVNPAINSGSPSVNDTNGNPIVDPFGQPGFPGFDGMFAKSTLGMVAQMQESGVPVTYAYISDAHDNHGNAGNIHIAYGPGEAGYVQQLKDYDKAFGDFFTRLANDGINKDNTLFVFSAEENDQFDGANVGRAIQPAPAGCGIVNNVFTPCNYTAGQIGEINTNLPGLLAAQKGNTTPFTVEPQGAVVYVNGQPALADSAARQLERDVGSLTNPNDPYTGVANEPIAAYLAGGTEEQILHIVNADPARTPTFALFPKPDYFFGSPVTCTPADQQPCASNTLGGAARFAWDHGYYAPSIDITWVGFVGPGVANIGLDGPEATDGPAIHDPNGGGTVPEFSTNGTWVDLPDIRPTLLWLAGLQDSYVNEGRVLSEILTDPNAAIAGSKYTDLAECYKQLNASVGEFGTNTLIADTAALKSGGGGDGVFKSTQKKLSKLLSQRDPLATELKNALFAAAFDDVALPGSGSQLGRCGAMLDRAEELVTGG